MCVALLGFDAGSVRAAMPKLRRNLDVGTIAPIAQPDRWCWRAKLPAACSPRRSAQLERQINEQLPLLVCLSGANTREQEYHEQTHLVWQCAGRWLNWMTSRRLQQLVFCGFPNSLGSRLAWMVAQSLEVPVFVVQKSILPGRFFCWHDFAGSWQLLHSPVEPRQDIRQLEADIQRAADHTRRRLAKSQVLSPLQKGVDPSPLPDGRYALLELDDPDSGFQHPATCWTIDPIRTLQRVAQWVPTEWKVVACASRWEWQVHKHSWWHNRLSALHGVMFATRICGQLIDRSQVVVSVGGAVGWLAARQAAPVVTLGPAWYGVMTAKADPEVDQGLPTARLPSPALACGAEIQLLAQTHQGLAAAIEAAL